MLSNASPFGFMLGRMITGGTTIDVMINALEQKGVARTLAEPNLVAMSGETASFLAGGEYPFPVPGSLGAVGIEYKPYGVGLSFTPTVLKDGVINLLIKPEVSQLDTSNPVTIGGVSVPPLIVRRASTTIELRDGQSFMLGGLLLNVGTTAQEQLPWAGDVPVLGALFRSASYQKNETDLAIIVTPRIVRPGRPGDVLKTPLDNTLPPNDADLFLMGKTGDHADRRTARARPAAEVHRSHPRSAEGKHQCRLRQRLRRWAGWWRRRSSPVPRSAAARISTTIGARPSRSAPMTRWPAIGSPTWSIRGPHTAPTGTSRSTANAYRRPSQRYRENKVTVPVSATTSSGTYQQQQQAAAAAVTAAQAASARGRR